MKEGIAALQGRIKRALKVSELGVFDGAHHKDFVIQHMIKELEGFSEKKLNRFLKEVDWERGIAP